MASTNLLRIDFSGVVLDGVDVVDSGLTRLRVNSGQDAWSFADYELLVDTSHVSFVNISLMDDFTTTSFSSDNTPPTASLVVGFGHLSQYADPYFLDFRQEEDGGGLDWGNYSRLDLEVLCDVDADTSLNLLESNSSFLVGIKDGAFLNLIFQNIAENSTEYTRSLMELSTFQSFFIPYGLEDKTVVIDYVLQDYTGDYRDSFLRIQSQYGVYENVVIGSWDSGGRIQGVALSKNKYYKIIVSSDDWTLDKGLVKYTQDGVQNIRVTSPAIYYPDSRLDDGSLTLWQNLSTSRVYCEYSATEVEDFVMAGFYVYNFSSGGLLYSTENISTPMGSFSFLVGANETVRVDCVLDVGWEFQKSNVFTFRDDARFLDPPFSIDILGFSLAEIFTGISLFLVIFLFGLGSHGNISFLALPGIGMLWLFSYWNWIQVDIIIMGFLAVFVVLFRLKESKLKGGGV
jgi:hypothetical protein